jgi:hypothetical protein
MERKTAPVRTSDPATSYYAAADVAPSVSTVRSRVLGILAGSREAAGGVTHDGLIALYRKYALRLGWPPASDSSIRTRCNELLKDGEVEQVPAEQGRSRYGRPALLWRAVIVQNSETSEAVSLDGGA